jgi:hypothetical protein
MWISPVIGMFKEKPYSIDLKNPTPNVLTETLLHEHIIKSRNLDQNV